MAVVLTLYAASAALAGSLTAPPGYVSIDTVLDLPPGAWFGGFDILPSGGFAISDGYGVHEIDPDGTLIRTLYTYPGYVYGSFVRYNAANGRVYFGESSQGTIRSVPLAGGEAALVATLAANYDMDFSGGRPYVVAGNTVYTVDEATGETDAIATAGSVSGPLAFDVAGNLIYGTGNPNWPPTLNDQNIYLWTASQVAEALGDTVLTADDAVVLAANVDAPSGFAFDGAGDLFYTDSQVSPGVIRMVRGGAADVFAVTQADGALPWTTTIRYNPSAGGVSAVVSWFDASWNTHTVISTLVPAPIPVPEPSSLVLLYLLIGLAGPAKLLRSCGR